MDVIPCAGDSGGPLFVDAFGDVMLGETSGGESRVQMASAIFTANARKLLRAAQNRGAGIPDFAEPELTAEDERQIISQTVDR